MSKSQTASLLPVIGRCDNFRVSENIQNLALFCLSDSPDSVAAPVGLLWPEVVQALREDNVLAENEGRHPSWAFLTSQSLGQITHVYFSLHLTTRESRSAALAQTCIRWRDSDIFAETVAVNKWRNELYPIYKHPFYGLSEENVACTIERAASSLFGIVTYGVHMTVFQRPNPSAGADREWMIWVPTRAKTKPTWPGLLDNTVAGGIPEGMPPFEALVKESMEEASLAEDVVRSHAHSVGAISYFFQKGRWLQPEVEYVYDLEIPSTATGAELEKFNPKPLDGEVEAFEFLPLSEVVLRMHKGLFKPNCALVLIDFMIRHGHITPETEPNYLEIVTSLHGRFDYALWTR
ncbi:hypothetical protein ACEPAH_2718 [Sanghuangporus vaninii]